MAQSSFDRIQRHLETQGKDTPVAEDLHEDLEALVRRCDRVRSLRQAFGAVELSPYMKSLLRVSNLTPAAGKVEADAIRAAAGV